MISPIHTQQFKLTNLFDNVAFDHRLKTGWGYACLIETGLHTILFDTGSDGNILLHNMAVLGINPNQIEAIVISHEHGDHDGGLRAITTRNLHAPVYAPRSFSEKFKKPLQKQSRLIEVSGPLQIIDNIHSTGKLGSKTIEQSIYIQTAGGLTLITGCAHPGIVDIVRHTRQFGPVHTIIGGWHLKDDKAGDIQAVIHSLKELGVRSAAPSHCTGPLGVYSFKEAFGKDYILAGTGAILRL